MDLDVQMLTILSTVVPDRKYSNLDEIISNGFDFERYIKLPTTSNWLYQVKKGARFCIKAYLKLSRHAFFDSEKRIPNKTHPSSTNTPTITPLHKNKSKPC